MNASDLTPRARALIAELVRYCNRWGADADRDHVERLERELNAEMEAHVNECQRMRKS